MEKWLIVVLHSLIVLTFLENSMREKEGRNYSEPLSERRMIAKIQVPITILKLRNEFDIWIFSAEPTGRAAVGHEGGRESIAGNSVAAQTCHAATQHDRETVSLSSNSDCVYICLKVRERTNRGSKGESKRNSVWNKNTRSQQFKHILIDIPTNFAEFCLDSHRKTQRPLPERVPYPLPVLSSLPHSANSSLVFSQDSLLSTKMKRFDRKLELTVVLSLSF